MDFKDFLPFTLVLLIVSQYKPFFHSKPYVNSEKTLRPDNIFLILPKTLL